MVGAKPNPNTLSEGGNAFLQSSSEQKQQALAHCESHMPCVACGYSVMQEQREKWLPLPKGGYVYQGIDYHVNDCVYIHNPKGLLDIGHIIRFNSDNSSQLKDLDVCLYGRYDSVVKAYGDSSIPLDNVSDVYLLEANAYSSSEETFQDNG